MALALLFAGVMKGAAYLFCTALRVQWWGSLAEQPLPASSLTRNSRNSRGRAGEENTHTNPNAVAIKSLPRTLNPISATDLFADEPPDTDRCNTTETARFLDIDEDNTSPLDDDSIPHIDREIPTSTM